MPQRDTVRVAMWSGPRTLSTALMRSWGSRGDTVVVDEPLYAFYLSRCPVDHPGREEILASQPTDWRAVLAALTSRPLPSGITISYQKHMTHHLLPEVDRSALAGLRHAYLIRDPAALIASYARVRAEPTLDDLGLPQQVDLYERYGGPVVDAGDLRRDPAGALSLLCGALGVAWDPAMLAWAPGPRPTDGVWAPHWYGSVWASTCFEPPGSGEAPDPAPCLPPHLARIADRCLPLYEQLRAVRVRVD